MYCIMEKYYKRTNLDDLGALLGSFNPYLFEGGMPADDAVWGDWKKCVRMVTTRESLTESEAFCAMIFILELYNNEFGFEIDELLFYLKEKSVTNSWQEWINCIESIANIKKNSK